MSKGISYSDKLKEHFRQKRLDALPAKSVIEKPEAKVGAAPQGLFKAIDGNGYAIDPGKAICPIFRQENDNSLKLIGTGFYVSNNGIFITAAHVLKDVVSEDGEQERAIVVFDFSNKNQYIIRNLLRGIVKNQSDVGVGMCREMEHKTSKKKLLNKILCLSKNSPKVGDKIFTYAYPNTVHRKTDKEEIHLNPLFYEGEMTDSFPNGRDSVFLPSKCYQTSITIHGGASGGPVFNSKGHVIGINSTGFEGCNDVSFISSIEDAFEISLPDIKLSETDPAKSYTIRELQRLGHIIEK